MKRKVFTVKRQNRSLCIQKQPRGVQVRGTRLHEGRVEGQRDLL